MWSCVVLTEQSDGGSAEVGGVQLVPVSDGAALARALEQLDSTWIVVASHPSQAPLADLALTLATGRWPERYVASLRTSHAPMAVTCALALAMATLTHPAQGLTLAEDVLANAWSGAWTRSVARLRTPAPTLWTHARSLLPGSGFLIRQWPDPAVLSRHGAAGIPAYGGDRVLMVQDGVPAALGRRLVAEGSVSDSRHVQLPATWADVYGTTSAAQVALMPADTRSLIRPVSHVCYGCDLELPTPVCPYCRVAAEPIRSTRRLPVAPAARPGPATRPVQAVTW